MPNKRQRPPDQLTGHRQVAPLTEVAAPDLRPPAMPPCPSGKWLVRTQELWQAMWRSPVAATWSREADLAQVEHLIWLLDERDRSRRAFSRRRLVEDAKGRPVLNPLGRHLQQLDRTIAQIVERLGLTPLDRMRLGIALVTGQAQALSLAERLNEELEEQPEVIDVDG